MAFTQKKPFSGFYYIFLLCAFYALLSTSLAGCSCSPTKEGEEFTELNKLFDLAVKQSDQKKADSISARRTVQFIDSAVQGRELDVRGRFKVLDFKGSVYFYIKDAANTMVYVDSMLNLLKENGPARYRKEYAKANYTKGYVLFFQNKYDEAYKYFFVARYTGQSIVDSCELAEYSYRIGMILFQQSKFIEAAENFREAFAQSENCSLDFVHYFRRQELISNISESFLKAGSLDSSLFYSEKALQYVHQFDGKFKGKEYFNDIARGVIYEYEGEVFKALGKYPKAKDLFKRDLEINSAKGYDNTNAQLSQVNLAEVYYLEGHLDSMAVVLNETRQSLDTIANKTVETEWNRLMWKYSAAKQKISEAFKYLQSYTALHDSAAAIKIKLNSTNITEQVKMLEGQYRISSLERENQLKNLYLLIFVMISILAVTIFLFSMFILKNERKNYSILKLLNERIEKQKIALESALTQLKDRNREKDRILHAVAHDLKSPVASISILADLILLESDQEAKLKMIQLIKTSSNNATSLISEILEAAGAKIKSGIIKAPVSVNAFLEEVVAPIRFSAAEKQQKIILQILDEDAQVDINKEKMQRVVTNIIVNAIKFSEVTSSITITTARKEDWIQLAVGDRGIGIPKELQSKVFDIFTEAKRPGTEGEKSFGLGLSICKQIVEAHDGKIWCESEEGKGTTFFVELIRCQPKS